MEEKQPHNVHMELERKLIEKFRDQAKIVFGKKGHQPGHPKTVHFA
jgi:hypothetical protein